MQVIPVLPVQLLDYTVHGIIIVMGAFVFAYSNCGIFVLLVVE